MDVVGVKVQSVVSMALIVHLTPLHGRKQGLMTDPPYTLLGYLNTYGNCKHGDKLSPEESKLTQILLLKD